MNITRQPPLKARAVETRSRGRRTRCRRAFAFPLVLLLSLAATLAVVIMLERQSFASVSIRRHTDAYIQHHTSFGLREMASRWQRQIRGQVAESLDPDGLAFWLNLPGEHRVQVYFDEAQGLALEDSSQLAGRRREIVESMREYLRARVEPDRFDQVFRPAGPSTISVTTAPREVLEALAAACVEPDQVEGVVKTMIENTSAGSESGSGISISAALADLNISAAARRELSGMIAARPTLWMVTFEEEDRRGELLWSARGLMEIQGGQQTLTYDQSGAFLTWEEVPVKSGESR